MSKKVKVGGKGKNPPQFARIGNGFPVPIKEAFDLLSPNPIDGIRIPLMDLFKKIHETGLGTSRLGPLTSLQLQNDLKAPYATIAGNMLMMGIMIAYAEMEFAEKSIFVFHREKLLQALKEYFDLKDLEIMNYRLSSGKMTEPADPGIPYSPDKYPPNQLEQLTQEHAKLAKEMREMLVTHQRERENFIEENRPVVRETLKKLPGFDSLYASAADPNDPNHLDSKQRLEAAEKTMVARLASKSRPTPEKLDEEQLIKIVGKQVFEVDPNRRKDLEVKKSNIQAELKKLETSKDPIHDKQKAILEKELKWVEKDLNKTNEQVEAEMRANVEKKFKVIQESEIASDIAYGIEATNTKTEQDPLGETSSKAKLDAIAKGKKMGSKQMSSFLKDGQDLHSSNRQLAEKHVNQVTEIRLKTTELEKELISHAKKSLLAENKK